MVTEHLGFDSDPPIGSGRKGVLHKHHYGGSFTSYIFFLEEFRDLSYVNMYKFGFMFLNGPTNVRNQVKES